jgi:ATP-dependent DNA helicase RecG
MRSYRGYGRSRSDRYVTDWLLAGLVCCLSAFAPPATLANEESAVRADALNPGTLPPPLRPEDLKRPHPSKPRNRLIAEVFFYVGWIEQWGSGFEKMLRECQAAGLPDPTWEERAGAFWLTFRKDLLTDEHLRSLDLTERQIKAVMWVKQQGCITNAEYQQVVQTSRETAKRDL